MTTTLLNAAVERAKIERLLPLRPQSKLARSGDSGPPLCLVDALSLGSTSAGQAYIAIVQWGGRQIVVPALVIEGELVRDPGIAHILRAGLYGNFEVEVFNGGIPAGSMRELEVDQSNDSVKIGRAHV